MSRQRVAAEARRGKAESAKTFARTTAAVFASACLAVAYVPAASYAAAGDNEAVETETGAVDAGDGWVLDWEAEEGEGGWEAAVTGLDESSSGSGELSIPKSVELDDGTTATVTEIGEEAFNECDELTGIDIPDTVVVIGAKAFRESGLASISIPASVAYIPYFCFWSCDDLAEVTFEGSSLEYIGYKSFYGCSSLEEITIPALKGDTYESVRYTGGSVMTGPRTYRLGEECLFDCASLSRVVFLAGGDTENYLLSSDEGGTSISYLGANASDLQVITYVKDLNLFSDMSSSGEETTTGTMYYAVNFYESERAYEADEDGTGASYTAVYASGTNIYDMLYDADAVADSMSESTGTMPELRDGYVWGVSDSALTGEDSTLSNCVDVYPVLHDNLDYAWFSVPSIVYCDSEGVPDLSEVALLAADGTEIGKRSYKYVYLQVAQTMSADGEGGMESGGDSSGQEAGGREDGGESGSEEGGQEGGDQQGGGEMSAQGGDMEGAGEEDGDESGEDASGQEGGEESSGESGGQAPSGGEEGGQGGESGDEMSGQGGEEGGQQGGEFGGEEGGQQGGEEAGEGETSGQEDGQAPQSGEDGGQEGGEMSGQEGGGGSDSAESGSAESGGQESGSTYTKVKAGQSWEAGSYQVYALGLGNAVGTCTGEESEDSPTGYTGTSFTVSDGGNVSVSTTYTNSNRASTIGSLALATDGVMTGDIEFVTVASSESWQDCLVAAGLAGVSGGQAFFTDGEDTDDHLYSAIAGCGTSKVYVIGGETAVGSSVMDRLEEVLEVKNGSISSLAEPYASDPEALSLFIYEKSHNTFEDYDYEWGDVAVVASPTQSLASMSATAYVWKSAAPVFFTDENGELSGDAMSDIASGGFSKVVILGPVSYVSTSMAEVIEESTGVEVERMAKGTGAYAASIDAQDYFDAEFSAQGGEASEDGEAGEGEEAEEGQEAGEGGQETGGGQEAGSGDSGSEEDDSQQGQEGGEQAQGGEANDDQAQGGDASSGQAEGGDASGQQGGDMGGGDMSGGQGGDMGGDMMGTGSAGVSETIVVVPASDSATVAAAAQYAATAGASLRTVASSADVKKLVESLDSIASDANITIELAGDFTDVDEALENSSSTTVSALIASAAYDEGVSTEIGAGDTIEEGGVLYRVASSSEVTALGLAEDGMRAVHIGSIERGETTYEVASVAAGAFEDEGALKKASVEATTVGPRAFSGCGELVSVEVDADEVDASAFQGCGSLKTATVSATTLGTSAFQGCSALESIDLKSKSLDLISASAFQGCENLTSIVVKSRKIGEVGVNAFAGTPDEGVTVKVPLLKGGSYKEMFTATGLSDSATYKQALLF